MPVHDAYKTQFGDIILPVHLTDKLNDNTDRFVFLVVVNVEPQCRGAGGHQVGGGWDPHHVTFYIISLSVAIGKIRLWCIPHTALSSYTCAACMVLWTYSDVYTVSDAI